MLLPVAGRAIIDYTLEAFEQAGVTDLAIIIGHQGQALKDWVEDGSSHGLRVQYITNANYSRGNALSVYAARAFTRDEPFLLSMADHMVSPDLLSGLLEFEGSANALAVDFNLSPQHEKEGTRVSVSPEGLVTHLGKRLSRWNAIDAGAFRLTSAIYDAITEVMDENRPEYELSQAIARMIERGQRLSACDISGCFWQDIDTWEDLTLIRKKVEGNGTWRSRTKG